MRVGSLFSGIGGIDLGLEWAGMKTAWQVEVDEKCQAVLAHHWPNVRRYSDVRRVHSASGCGAGVDGCPNCLFSVDLVCGGFPCQDVSVAGKRAGLAGERSGLWHEFHRVVAELAPRWVLIENVPGLLSSNRGEDFAVILAGLVDLGYGVAWRVLDAQYFGVPQRRRRVFIVGCLGDWAAPAAVLFEPESVCGDSPPRREAGTTTSALTRNGVGGGGGPDDNSAQANHLIPGVPELTGSISGVAHPGGHNGQDDGSVIVASLGGGNYGQGNSDEGVPNVVVGSLSAGAGTNRMSPGYNRDDLMVPGAASVRRLTPTECERLQGFPDGWTAGQSDSARYRQLGNAVAVPVAEWIGSQLIRQLVTAQREGVA